MAPRPTHYRLREDMMLGVESLSYVKSLKQGKAHYGRGSH